MLAGILRAAASGCLGRGGGQARSTPGPRLRTRHGRQAQEGGALDGLRVNVELRQPDEFQDDGALVLRLSLAAHDVCSPRLLVAWRCRTVVARSDACSGATAPELLNLLRNWL